MEIRDPVLGFIHPRDRELEIINAPVMQRLRRIKQLAMAHLLYPGATHTRFEHSLGVFHIASRMAHKIPPLAKNEDKSQLVRFAALLHDIGHGPFSHVSDVTLERLSSDTLPPGKARPHEKIAAKILEANADEELQRVLSAKERTGIISLLTGINPPFTIMREILSGGVDADRMDYLLRDSHFCGVKYGVFDLDRMLDSLSFYENKEENDLHLAIKQDCVNTIEQFILAKYFMTTQVYMHRVRSICDAMIARAVELGLNEGIDFLSRLYRYEETEGYLRNYLQWHDSRVIDSIVNDDRKGRCQKIFKRLHERRLFKMVFHANLRDMDNITSRFRDRLSEISSPEETKLRHELEHEISRLPELGCPSEYVILNCLTIESAKQMFLSSEGELQVESRWESSRRFEEESAIFRSINESVKDQFLEVYARFEHKGRDKERRLDGLKKAIPGLLQDKGREEEDE